MVLYSAKAYNVCIFVQLCPGNNIREIMGKTREGQGGIDLISVNKNKVFIIVKKNYHND
jgi:hypothetical protein